MTIAPAAPMHPVESRKTDRLRGLLIVGIAFVACLGVSIWAKDKSRPETSQPPGPPTTQGVVGWPSAVDPVRTLPQARELTRRSLLRNIDADGVKSDGTMDFKAGQGSVRYTFQSPPMQGPQPPREPG